MHDYGCWEHGRAPDEMDELGRCPECLAEREKRLDERLEARRSRYERPPELLVFNGKREG